MEKHILLVDDEAATLRTLGLLLEREGIVVYRALNGLEALGCIKQNRIDVILTDLKMPQMDGMQLFYAVKKLNPFAHLIIMTGAPSLQNMSEVLEAGAYDYVLKPFEFDELFSIITAAFARINRWRNLRAQWLERKQP